MSSSPLDSSQRNYLPKLTILHTVNTFESYNTKELLKIVHDVLAFFDLQSEQSQKERHGSDLALSKIENLHDDEQETKENKIRAKDTHQNDQIDQIDQTSNNNNAPLPQRLNTTYLYFDIENTSRLVIDEIVLYLGLDHGARPITPIACYYPKILHDQNPEMIDFVRVIRSTKWVSASLRKKVQTAKLFEENILYSPYQLYKTHLVNHYPFYLFPALNIRSLLNAYVLNLTFNPTLTPDHVNLWLFGDHDDPNLSLADIFDKRTRAHFGFASLHDYFYWTKTLVRTRFDKLSTSMCNQELFETFFSPAFSPLLNSPSPTHAANESPQRETHPLYSHYTRRQWTHKNLLLNSFFNIFAHVESIFHLQRALHLFTMQFSVIKKSPPSSPTVLPDFDRVNVREKIFDGLGDILINAPQETPEDIFSQTGKMFDFLRQFDQQMSPHSHPHITKPSSDNDARVIDYNIRSNPKLYARVIDSTCLQTEDQYLELIVMIRQTLFYYLLFSHNALKLFLYLFETFSVVFLTPVQISSMYISVCVYLTKLNQHLSRMVLVETEFHQKYTPIHFFTPNTHELNFQAEYSNFIEEPLPNSPSYNRVQIANHCLSINSSPTIFLPQRHQIAFTTLCPPMLYPRPVDFQSVSKSVEFFEATDNNIEPNDGKNNPNTNGQNESDSENSNETDQSWSNKQFSEDNDLLSTFFCLLSEQLFEFGSHPHANGSYPPLNWIKKSTPTVEDTTPFLTFTMTQQYHGFDINSGKFCSLFFNLETFFLLQNLFEERLNISLENFSTYSSSLREQAYQNFVKEYDYYQFEPVFETFGLVTRQSNRRFFPHYTQTPIPHTLPTPENTISPKIDTDTGEVFSLAHHPLPLELWYTGVNFTSADFTRADLILEIVQGYVFDGGSILFEIVQAIFMAVIKNEYDVKEKNSLTGKTNKDESNLRKENGEKVTKPNQFVKFPTAQLHLFDHKFLQCFNDSRLGVKQKANLEEDRPDLPDDHIQLSESGSNNAHSSKDNSNIFDHDGTLGSAQIDDKESTGDELPPLEEVTVAPTELLDIKLIEATLSADPVMVSNNENQFAALNENSDVLIPNKNNQVNKPHIGKKQVDRAGKKKILKSVSTKMKLLVPTRHKDADEALIGSVGYLGEAPHAVYDDEDDDYEPYSENDDNQLQNNQNYNQYIPEPVSPSAFPTNPLAPLPIQGPIMRAGKPVPIVSKKQLRKELLGLSDVAYITSIDTSITPDSGLDFKLSQVASPISELSHESFLLRKCLTFFWFFSAFVADNFIEEAQTRQNAMVKVRKDAIRVSRRLKSAKIADGGNHNPNEEEKLLALQTRLHSALLQPESYGLLSTLRTSTLLRPENMNKNRSWLHEIALQSYIPVRHVKWVFALDFGFLANMTGYTPPIASISNTPIQESSETTAIAPAKRQKKYSIFKLGKFTIPLEYLNFCEHLLLKVSDIYSANFESSLGFSISKASELFYFFYQFHSTLSLLLQPPALPKRHESYQQVRPFTISHPVVPMHAFSSFCTSVFEFFTSFPFLALKYSPLLNEKLHLIETIISHNSLRSFKKQSIINILNLDRDEYGSEGFPTDPSHRKPLGEVLTRHPKSLALGLTELVNFLDSFCHVSPPVDHLPSNVTIREDKLSSSVLSVANERTFASFLNSTETEQLIHLHLFGFIIKAVFGQFASAPSANIDQSNCTVPNQVDPHDIGELVKFVVSRDTYQVPSKPNGEMKSTTAENDENEATKGKKKQGSKYTRPLTPNDLDPLECRLSGIFSVRYRYDGFLESEHKRYLALLFSLLPKLFDGGVTESGKDDPSDNSQNPPSSQNMSHLASIFNNWASYRRKIHPLPSNQALRSILLRERQAVADHRIIAKLNQQNANVNVPRNVHVGTQIGEVQNSYSSTIMSVLNVAVPILSLVGAVYLWGRENEDQAAQKE
jgi:hypothetical protein